MFGEIIEGKNNNEKKNKLDLIRLGIFMKDALDLLIKKSEKDIITFVWQTIGKCSFHNHYNASKLCLYTYIYMAW